MNLYSFLLTGSWYSPDFKASSLREAIKLAEAWLTTKPTDYDGKKLSLVGIYVRCKETDFCYPPTKHYFDPQTF